MKRKLNTTATMGMTEATFFYKMYYKNDLPHDVGSDDVGSNSNKIWLKKFTNVMCI